MKKKQILLGVVCCLLFFNGIQQLIAQTKMSYIEIKGKIVDNNSNEALVSADIIVKDSNISTITNPDGDFSLKIPDSLATKLIVFSYLGYQKKEMKISELSKNLKIKLVPSVTELVEVQIKTFKDAETLLRETLKNRNTAYNDSNALMTAFYRETIKKRKKDASLSEAVVKIHKQPYGNLKKDDIELIKSRKSSNYKRLDTLALKLQGGPFSNLFTDIIKYPEYIFDNKNIDLYDFSFDEPTYVNNKPVYVINFKQKQGIVEPLYYGKLYIYSETLALTNAVFKLNVENKELSSEMYVRKKPTQVEVYPTEATYRVNYRTQDGKWHYAYSNIMLTFKVNWKDKLFNSTYTLNSEMAITDWRKSNPILNKTREKMLKPTTILADETSGFKDPAFWGEYNIIEPEKSIESAIEKIKKKLDKTSNI